MSILKVGPRDFQPEIVIFDKDGTLIDFDWMWGAWITDLAARLETASRLPTREPLFEAMGFDVTNGRVLAHGKLAATPMAELYELTVEMLKQCGLSDKQAQSAVAEAWFIPDPVALAKPFAELKDVFGQLKNNGVKIAVATTDDRDPTTAMLEGFGVWELVDAMICADDGIRVKPEPDMIHTICERLNVPVNRAVMVGDSLLDVQMGKASGAGLTVGVLSGVSSRDVLTPYADVVIEDITELI
jgi:phosphoglycolate phosphatase